MAPDTVTADTARGRGRPREFDEDEVLDALVELFWNRGYAGASLTDIVEAAGLNKSSLYNTFGSKDELFARVLERYMDFRGTMIAEVMAGDGGLDQLGAFFDLVREEFAADSGGMGCLAVNASTELGLRDDRVTELASRYRGIMADGLRGPLVRAGERAEIDPTLVDDYVDMLVAFSVALSVAARSGAASTELLRNVASMERLVESWRVG